MKDFQLSKNFMLSEFTKSKTAESMYIRNNPRPADVERLRYLCHKLLQPARDEIGEPIVITSGYRSKALNMQVGGVYNSQHLRGEAADIHLPSPDYANKLVEIFSKNEHLDQLLFEHIGSTVWLHVSCAYDRKPRNMIRLNYQPK